MGFPNGQQAAARLTKEPTQVRFPWRSALRTGFVALIALASLIPWVFTDMHLPAVGLGGQILAVATFINRLMLVPGVNEWLTSIGLGATPKT